jgi:iron complex transport system ATP-binding protein
MLETHNLGFGWGKTRCLSGVSLSVKPGEVVSVIGPNGAGKSTLLKCILHILKPGEGEARVHGKNVGALHPRERAMKMAYVPQALPSKFPMSVFDVVLLGRRPYLSWKAADRDIEKAGRELERMGLSRLACRDYDTLSGGQKQKVMLARAFAQDAEFLLLDEPTSNLDLRHQLEVMCLLKEYTAQDGKGALVVLHNLNTAARFSDRIVMLQEGSVFRAGLPWDVLSGKNIETVYGVEVETVGLNGCRVVVPLRVAG